MSYAVPGTRKEAVLRQLRQEIISSELKPGTILKDAEVAARLGVSITPVREAIGQLTAEGLIDVSSDRTRHVAKVDRKAALDLIDVITVLAGAGFAWGVSELAANRLPALRRTFREFADALRRGDATTAATVGAEFTRIVVAAGGNRELLTHVELILTRQLRMVALTPNTHILQIWLEGYAETLALLEAGSIDAAGERYRRIYTEYRACVEKLPFD